MTMRIGLALLLAVAAADPVAGRESESKALVDYRVEYFAPDWRVTIEARGLNVPGQRVALDLHDFGSWLNLADYYLQQWTSQPPMAPDPNDPTRWILQIPKDWDGRLRVEYSLHAAAEGTSAQRANALLPVRSPTYTYGCTDNTLMNVLVAAKGDAEWKRLNAQRTVKLVPPAGWKVFSGWAGESEGPQRFEMHAGDRNGLIVFGEFTARFDVTVAGIPITVRQFGKGPPSAAKVGEWLSRLVPLMATTMASKPGPVRVFLTDSADGGMMTDKGLMVGIRQSWTPNEVDLFSTRHTIAHELFHAWLGGMLRPPNDMIWFLEGFTDYLSLWHASAADVVPPEWFVRRIGELSALARSSSLGRISFLDPGVSWRDDNGPNERMAYVGAHVVAFAIDVELWKRGRSAGILALMADLLGANERKCTQAEVRKWFASNGVLDVWEKYVAGRTVPDVETLLKSIGCQTSFNPVDLTYIGVRAVPEDPAKPMRRLRIVELDPNGPAARAGAKVDDVITGWYPFRSEMVEVGPEVKTPFTFGLTSFLPDQAGAYVGILRGATEHKLDLVPTVMKGGRSPALVPGPRFDAFLKRTGG